MELLIPILAVMGFFGSILTFLYMFFKSRHRERMAMIESGTPADILVQNTFDNRFTALKWGMLLVGAGIGFYLGIISEMMFGIEDGLGAFPLTFVGGGLGLILFYKVATSASEN